MNFLHVFTLFVIDIHKNMLISLFPTLFGHFQFLGSAGQIPKLILTLRPISFGLRSNTVLFVDPGDKVWKHFLNE